MRSREKTKTIVCMFTIHQRHKIQLTEKQQSVILRYSTPKTTAVAIYYCDYPKGPITFYDYLKT